MTATDLPAWSEAFTTLDDVAALPLPSAARDWAWGGATGRGAKVAVVDSGVDADHPWLQRGPVTGVQGYATLTLDPDADDGFVLTTDPHDDLVGHGTACAAIIRALAPECELYSVRVLGAKDKLLGHALFSDQSQIVLRVVSRGEAAVDAAFWRGRLEAAVRFRTSLGLDATAYRLVHGEADLLPSLIVDRYGDVLVLQALSQGMDRLVPTLVPMLVDLTGATGVLA